MAPAADYLILKRRAAEEKRMTYEQLTKDNYKAASNAEWEIRTAGFIEHTAMQSRYNAIRAADQSALNERRQRLSDFLAEEQSVFQQQLEELEASPAEMKARMEELDMRGDAFKERESRVAVGARTVIVDDANGGQEEQVARAREQREALASLETELHETRSRMEEECTSRDREIERLRTDVRESRHRVISIKDMPNLDISRGGTSVGRGLLRRRRARRHSIASACPSSARGGKLTVGETKNMEAWRPLRSTESGDRDSGGDADRNVRVWRDAAEAKVAAKCRDTESKLSEALGECGDLRERLRSLAEQAEEKQGNREFAIREHKQHVVSLTSQHDTIVTEFHLVRRFGMAAV